MNSQQLQIVTYDNNNEKWSIIDGYDDYFISNLGNIYSLKSSKFLKPRKSDGYLRVTLCKKGKVKSHFVHKLIASAFILKNGDRNFVNHINSNRSDNRIENLEWCTTSENIIHGWKYGNIIGITGRKHSVQTKYKISKNKKGLKHSEFHNHKISSGLRNGVRASKIIQYDLLMNEICRFNCIKDASEKLSINYDGIINNLRGLTKKYKGYVFKYE